MQSIKLHLFVCPSRLACSDGTTAAKSASWSTYAASRTFSVTSTALLGSTFVFRTSGASWDATYEWVSGSYSSYTVAMHAHFGNSQSYPKAAYLACRRSSYSGDKPWYHYQINTDGDAAPVSGKTYSTYGTSYSFSG